MPLALLLSPDDQAVSAITAVLEEMSVTCERPLDGVSAAKQLNSYNFDLVLVDCENLPAAKLIFDVCRRGKGGNNPVPIAIVDGRAGLPTAFRLGAELILTKPVAKDQARSTVRTAVSRVKKEDPASTRPTDAHIDAKPNDAVNVNADETTSLLTGYETAPEPPQKQLEARAAAATAATVSSHGSHFDGPTFAAPSSTTQVSGGQSNGVQVSDTHVTSSVSAPQMKMSATSATRANEKLPVGNISAAGAESKLAASIEPSDDPVLAELERTEAGEEAPAEPTPEAVHTPILTAYSEDKKKSRGSLVALLVLVLAVGGFYVAWMYQPGFRELAQPQIDRVLDMVGMRHPPTPVAVPVKPAVQPSSMASPPNSADSISTTLPTTSEVSGTTPTTASGVAATGAQPLPAPTSTAASATAAVQATPSPAPSQQTSGTAPATATAVKTGINKTDDKATAPSVAAPKSADSKGVATAPTDAELPGEKTAVILSSQGAEKRLARSVQPKFPAGARTAEGTLVLKAVIDENGKVTGARLVEGNPALGEAAINAVKQWRYRPYVRDGKALPFQTVVIIDFQRP